MRRRGLSPNQINEAVQLYGEGCSLARIGERMGVDRRRADPHPPPQPADLAYLAHLIGVLSTGMVVAS